MKKQALFLMAVAVLTAISCIKKDDDSDNQPKLTVNFKADYASDPLLMFDRVYDYEDALKLKFQLFQFYISNLRLIKENESGGTEEVPVLEVDLISFADVYTDAEAAAGITSAPISIPAGTYSGLKLGIGLTPELNSTQPKDYKSGHPLSENYWDDANSYIYFKVEGLTDLDGDGELANKLTFHVGSEVNYREMSFTKPFTVAEQGEVSLTFLIDMYQLLVDESTGSFLNFREVQASHSNTSPSAAYLADRFPAAIVLQ